MVLKSEREVPTREAGVSLADIAYGTLKHKIIVMEFKPGEYLNENQLSKALGIGRTPIHQALIRLMLEGMVEIIPRKGVIVKNVSLNEILEIIDARVINETHVASLAATFADQSDIARLDEILKKATMPSSSLDLVTQMLLDKEFHLALSNAAKNTVLADILLRLHERSLRFWFISLKDPVHHKDVHREHQKILDAIKERSPEKAAKATREHIESFRRAITQHV